nr:hypothetical protein [uncultured Kingella sp.]
MSMERRRLVANSFKQSMAGLPRCKMSANRRRSIGVVFRLPLGELSGSLKMGLRFVVGFECGVYHASRADGALTFLCFAKEK